MQVTLINYTPDALETLLFTKQTRLALSPGLMEEIKAWPQEKKLAELAYMRETIQSSWEFVDYTFLIDGVSRAFTHQLVRSRANSYAQQSQRTVDMSGFEYIVPATLSNSGDFEICGSKDNIEIEGMREGALEYHDAMCLIDMKYEAMRRQGVNPQDARGILPTNVSTNIVVKATLRSMSDMAKTRLCTRTQGEYQDVFKLMRAEVIKVHPWAAGFIQVACAATGVCQFPNYKECPIKGPIFNPDTGHRWDGNPTRPDTRAEIQEAWERMDRFEAVPKEAKKNE